MVLGGAGANDYDASGSFGGRPMTAIDELVQQRLEMIAHSLEEQKIAHERSKQEDLREIEQQKRVEIA